MFNQLQTLFDHLPLGILIIDKQNRVLYTNAACSSLIGIHPEPAISDWAHQFDSSKVTSFQARMNGTNLLVSCLPFSGYLASSFLMIVQENDCGMLEKELYTYRAFLESISDLGLLAIDKDEKIILYNAASERHDSLLRSEVIGHRFTEVFDNTTNSAILKALKTGNPAIDHEIAYESNGKVQVHFGSGYPVKKDGQIIGSFAVLRFHDSIRMLLQKTMELQTQLFSSQSQGRNGTQYHFSDIIGESNAIRLAIKLAHKAAFSPASVLIHGETGTGKELFAQSIHNAGPHHEEPFVAINCAAIPDTLLESTLFGSAKGAYTGAVNTPGLFEQAKNGTIFLDEINSMPMALQAKLLRVIQERKVRRVGGSDEIEIHCRILSSCNQSPLECVAKNLMRDDLYYRLSVIDIEVPPLRSRQNDIVLMAEHFVNKYSKIYGVDPELSQTFKDILLRHNWPGNIRELQHVIESAMVMLEPGNDLTGDYLPNYLKTVETDTGVSQSSRDVIATDGYARLKEKLATVERNAITLALKDNNWNLAATARAIGYSRSNLQYRMQILGIEPDDNNN